MTGSPLNVILRLGYAISEAAEPKIRRKSLVTKLPSLFAAIAVIVLIGVHRMIVDRFETHAIARSVRCPLLPTLPRHRQDRPVVLPRIPRSWTWPGESSGNSFRMSR